MEKMLVISQNEADTWFISGISIGIRPPRIIIGTKIREWLKEHDRSEDAFVESFENSYRESLKRVLDNRELPKDKLFNKITVLLEKPREYFLDTQLKNVIVNDSHMVVAEYATEERTTEVKKELDEYITDCYAHNLPIIIRMPKE